jgi:hypothetical protein
VRIEFVFDGSHILFDGFMWFEGGLNFFFAEDSSDFVCYSLDEREAGSVIRGLVISPSSLLRLVVKACFDSNCWTHLPHLEWGE